MSVRRVGHEVSKSARHAIGLSTMSDDKLQEGISLVFLAQARMLNSRYGDALKASSKAETIFRDCGEKVMEARAAALVAQVHAFNPKQETKAEELANKALELARAAKDFEAEDAAIRILEAIYARQQASAPAPEMVYQLTEEVQVAGASSAAVEVKKGLEPEDVRPKVLEVVKNVTGGEEEVMMDTPLMDTGMDSLSAVAFRNELNRSFPGANLPASLMFDYPNINQITDHIVEQTSA